MSNKGKKYLTKITPKQENLLIYILANMACCQPGIVQSEQGMIQVQLILGPMSYWIGERILM